MGRTIFAIVLAASGCYHPTGEVPCTIRCDNGVGCPPSFDCGPDSLCHEAGGLACNMAPADAPEHMLDTVVPGDGPCIGHMGVLICDSYSTIASLPQPFDTDVPANCTRLVDNGYGQQLCVFEAGSIKVSANIRVTGSHALVVFASSSITIDATIDAASHLAVTGVGPGADDMSCPQIGVSGGGSIGGAGGPGGSFSTSGGSGGAGGGLLGNGATIAAPGVAPATYVRGGCSGSIGGAGHASSAGTAGHGGGAIYLLAGAAITVGGAINASGSGGGAVSSGDAGGGGGGTGGLIVLDAPAVSVNGTLMATGGGGGASSPMMGATAGGEPVVGTPFVAASGGNGGANGASGGSGGVLTAGGGGASGVGSTSIMTGGAGGGGGAGHIVVFGSLSTTTATALAPSPELR